VENNPVKKGLLSNLRITALEKEKQVTPALKRTDPKNARADFRRRKKKREGSHYRILASMGSNAQVKVARRIPQI